MAYRIPALTNEVKALRRAAVESLNSALGPHRGMLLGVPLTEYWQTHLSGLGSSERTIVFGRNKGDEALWFGEYDHSRNTGGSIRLDRWNVPGPDHPVHVYAAQLGIELPSRD